MIPKSTKYFRYYTYIEPVLKSPIIKTYGYAIFTIVMTIVFIIFAIKPTLETILVLQKKLTSQQEIVSKLDEVIKSLQTAQDNYRKIDDNILLKVNAAVPDNPDLTNLIRSLENTTAQTEASISALQFQPVVIDQNSPKENYTLQELAFTFNVEGSYDNLKLILQNLKSNIRLVTIDNLSFNKVQGGKTLLMSVTGKAYYLK